MAINETKCSYYFRMRECNHIYRFSVDAIKCVRRLSPAPKIIEAHLTKILDCIVFGESFSKKKLYNLSLAW